MGQILQLAGALAILAAFALAQLGALDARSHRALALNLGGALVLAVEAYVERQWGFLVLEAAWSLVSAWSLVAAVRTRTSVGPRPYAAGPAGPTANQSSITCRSCC